MKAYYDEKPSKYEAVGNGSYLYRYNIKEVEVHSIETTDSDSGKEKKTQWECDEVTVWAPVSSNKIMEAVISHEWDANYEQKLLNEYYSAQLGILTDDAADKATERYKNFLSERHTLKESVDEDCEELGIL